LSNGRRINARTVVIASGARYRKPDIPHLQEFEGHGVWYWASPFEARLCRKEEIVIVGGGNSAGQAAVYLHDFARKVWMLVRGPSLVDSMSRYLINRIAAIDNIEVLTNAQIIALSGTPQRRLECVRWRVTPTGQEAEKPIRNVFMMIGADPATGWLKGSGVALDEKQFVKTAANATSGNGSGGSGRRLPHESSVPNVFAVGDVRAGSVKRVGAAIGEGAAVVAQLHAVLATSATAVQDMPGAGHFRVKPLLRT
jgi:thioredoxin reductase (NADPH)